MIDGLKRVVLVNIDDSTYDKKSGDRLLKIQKGKVIALKVDLAGLYTKQLAQSEGFIVTLSIDIPRILYDSEKYCFFDDRLFEIKSNSKAKLSTNMLLNISEIKNDEIIEIIKAWLKEKI